MTSKRTVVVAVAVAVGVVASVLSYVFLNNAQNNAYHNAKLVNAYVIAKPIPRTLSGVDAANGGYLQEKKVRPSSGPPPPSRVCLRSATRRPTPTCPWARSS